MTIKGHILLSMPTVELFVVTKKLKCPISTHLFTQVWMLKIGQLRPFFKILSTCLHGFFSYRMHKQINKHTHPLDLHCLR